MPGITEETTSLLKLEFKQVEVQLVHNYLRNMLSAEVIRKMDQLRDDEIDRGELDPDAADDNVFLQEQRGRFHRITERISNFCYKWLAYNYLM